MEETVQSEELLKQRFFMDDVLTALQRMNPEGAERILKKCNLCDLINMSIRNKALGIGFMIF